MSTPLHPTTDPYLASFLVSQGARLVGSTRLAPKKVEFRFAADRALHDLLRQYWSNAPLSLVPSRLFTSLRTLKCRGPSRSVSPTAD